MIGFLVVFEAAANGQVREKEQAEQAKQKALADAWQSDDEVEEDPRKRSR